MFSSKPKEAAPAIPSSVVSPTAQPNKRATVRSSAPSIISADLTVMGTLISEGDIQIEGTVEGDVRSANLVVGEKAQVQGELQAEDLVVRGRVVGRIRARKVQLAATAHIEGDILHETLVMEAGAFFDGNCRHSNNPLGDEMKRPVIQQAVPAPKAPVAAVAASKTAHNGYSGHASLAQPAE